ncbi:MAG TPA: glycosyltransferase family 4 protein [Acidimicrobiia bacterium]|nr:glycosyltransferase family 4 protein [Acidimicrobiia bacterium]
MIVLHVLPIDLKRGAQRYAQVLADHLQARGSRNVVLTIFGATPGESGHDESLGVDPGVLRRVGLDPRAVLQLRRAVARIRPDVVIAHGGEPAKYCWLALPRTLPLVYLTIGSAHPRLRRPLSSMLHRRYTRRADVVVAVSAEVAEETRELHGLEPERIVVIPNGRDREVFGPSEIESGADQCRLIWVGQLDEAKRPGWFIEVVRSLVSGGARVDALIVGDGPLRQDIEAAALAAGVKVLGSRDDVPSLMADSDVLVFTGRPPEGMPGVLIEAGLCGLAVVSTRVPGAVDVVKDGVTGILVDIDDRDGLVAAAKRLVEDPAERRDMGVRARRRCEELFSMEATVARWESLLEALAR